MKKFNISIIALAIGFTFSLASVAQSMSKNDYSAGKDKIAALYKSEKTACATLSGNAKDICIAEAKGKEMVAKAGLEETYQPSRKTHYQARVSKAEADYALANEKCDDLAGNSKDICRKEAKSKLIAAKADAKVQMKTTDANAVASEKTLEARNKANDQVNSARKDAAEDKSEAQYAVAKEKCDTYAGGAKDQCMDQAKARFGK
jgi:hypothetical protein